MRASRKAALALVRRAGMDAQDWPTRYELLNQAVTVLAAAEGWTDRAVAVDPSTEARRLRDGLAAAQLDEGRVPA